MPALDCSSLADEPEDDLAMAKRHVREAEEHVARQLVLIRKLDLAGRHDEARSARELLATLTDTLQRRGGIYR